MSVSTRPIPEWKAESGQTSNSDVDYAGREPPETDHHVFDSGSLVYLSKLGKTYGNIANIYARFVLTV